MEIKELYNIYKKHPIICTDTRKITKGSLFFALKGKNFNGNEFAKKAIKEGCSFAIIDEKDCENDQFIQVENVLQTLQKLAKYHRQNISIPIIGITGTNGKTTSKELIHYILGSEINCYATKGNLNNQIGVPISILEINDNHEIAVIEMGASEKGEIKKLCNISKPDTGVITNVGLAHLEGFGTFQGVVQAKTELYNFIKKNKGTIFVNSEDKILLEKSKEIQRRLYGKSKKSDFYSKIIQEFPFMSLQIGETTINSNLIGEFQYYNILAACIIGDFYKIDSNKLKLAIENYKPTNNRTEIVETKKNYIILDAYNANPSSMNYMIESFCKLKKSNKLCILGEMRELGTYSQKEHLSLIQKMKKEEEIETIFIGKEFTKIYNENTFINTDDFLENIDKYDLKNRTILVKGSRGIKLENLIDYL